MSQHRISRVGVVGAGGGEPHAGGRPAGPGPGAAELCSSGPRALATQGRPRPHGPRGE